MIEHIYISNFRSIVELEIEPRNLTALIGPNSTGKTNVLKAIDLVLGEGWTTKAKIARELFNDVSKPIIIEIRLKEPFVFKNNKQIDCRVFKVKLEMKMLPDFSCKNCHCAKPPNGLTVAYPLEETFLKNNQHTYTNGNGSICQIENGTEENPSSVFAE